MPVFSTIEMKSGWNRPNLEDFYHLKVDILRNPNLDDSDCACKSSKKRNPNLDDILSECAFILSWSGCFVHYKNVQNHPKDDDTKHPIWDYLQACLETFELYKTSTFGWLTESNHLDDFIHFSVLCGRKMHISSKFECYFTTNHLHSKDSCGSQIIPV